MNDPPPLLRRLYAYQRERAPLLVLGLTTGVVALSAYAVASRGEVKTAGWAGIAAFLTALLYTLHVRFLDEFKDYEHDRRYYPARPLPRGLVTLNELRALTIFTVAAEVALNLAMPKPVLGVYLAALGYSLLAGQEFGCGQWLRRRFFLYGLLHFGQFGLLLTYLYAAAGARWAGGARVLPLHFGLTLLTLVLLEWARKMRPPEEENESRDTYSAQLGVAGASLAFAALASLAFVLHRSLIAALGLPGIRLAWAAAGYGALVLALLAYAYFRRRFAAGLLQLAALAYYVTAHASVFLPARL